MSVVMIDRIEAKILKKRIRNNNNNNKKKKGFV